jgi:hypothetical protein
LDDDGVAETVFWTDYNIERKITSGLFRWDSSLELNNKKVGNTPSFPSVTSSVSSDKRFRSYGILKIGNTAEICLEQNSSCTELDFWALD